MKKKIYNIIRNYLKKQFTGNLGKVVEKDDALYCYVDKKKCRRRRFFLDIMCLGIKRCDKELAKRYNFDKKVYYIELDNNTSNLFDRIFAGCVNLQSIDLKNTKIKTIGSYAFANCINLKSVTFPDTLMSIGDNAFSYCRSLTEISLPKALWAIGDEAFQSCYELKTIVFDGDSELVSIGYNAFSDCISLKSFDMPDSVTSIGSNVFENCLSLESVKISQNLVSIPSYSFRYCENLKLVTIPENSKIKEIGQSAFYNCKNLQKISISPDSELEQIGAEAFANCSSLESILLPSKLNYIYTRSNSDDFKSSFENCTNLAYVYNYSTLYLSIGNSGNGAVALNAYVVYNKEQYDLTIDDIIFETIGNVKYYIEPITNNYVAYGIVDKSQEVVLDVKTNRIGPKIFYNNSNLTSINLQDLTNLIEICTQAFYNCYNLISVSFPNSLKYIGPSAFQGCTTLSSITIPDSLVEIGSDAFYGCSALSSVLINDSSNLQIIGSYAFQNCSKLVNVILPEGLLKIGDYAFSNCSALSSIDIPDSLIEIGKNAFDDCSALSSVLINDSSNLQIIGSYAFYNCAELETITIPEKVIKIGSYAFYKSGLKTAVFKSPSGWGYMSGEEREGILESSLSNSSTAASYLCSRSYNYYYWTWEKIS